MIAVIFNLAPLTVNLDTWSDSTWGLAVLLAVSLSVALAFPLVDFVREQVRFLAIFRAQERRLR